MSMYNNQVFLHATPHAHGCHQQMLILNKVEDLLIIQKYMYVLYCLISRFMHVLYMSLWIYMSVQALARLGS